MKGSVVGVERLLSYAVTFFFLKISKLILSRFIRQFASLQYFNEPWPSLLSAITHGKPVLPCALSCIALNGIFFCLFVSSAQSFNNIPIVWLKSQSCCVYLGSDYMAMTQTR